MKKIVTSLSILLLASQMLMAQSVKRYTLFEHFTQASCGPCAQQNPAFEVFKSQNLGRFHHIAYHTSWPGVDPMNAVNPTEVADRVSYYGIGGVPAIMVNGIVETQPGGINAGMLSANELSGSPIYVAVSENTVGTTRNVDVKVGSVNNLPSGNYVLRAAVIEKMVSYTTAPGNNGEKDFPNVMRKMLTAAAGDTYTPATIGQTANFTYNYTLDPTWDASQIYVVAWVQAEPSKEVINSGATDDWKLNYLTLDPSLYQATPGQATTIGGNIDNNFTVAEDVIATIKPIDAPADWSASLTQNGLSIVVDSTNVSAATGTTSLGVQITAGNTVSIGKYMLTLTSVSNPTNSIKKVFVVNNGIMDLVLGNSDAYQNLYVNGLVYAGNVVHGSLTRDEYMAAKGANILNGVKNIYYNVGWVFPALTEATVAHLVTHLSTPGNNLMVGGQDIGWDVFETVANGANSNFPSIQAFYNNTLHATWTADGGTTNNKFTAVASDSIYGSFNFTNLSNAGTSYAANFYPDEMTVNGSNAYSIFTYPSGKIGGIRSFDGNVKTVYTGVGIEQFADASFRNDFMKTTHDWFYNKPVGIAAPEFANTLAQNYPNPADVTTFIAADLKGKEGMIRVMDMTGKIVAEKAINPSEKGANVVTRELSNGTYIYQLISEGNILSTKKLVVLHP